jgi:hypothetical protein
VAATAGLLLLGFSPSPSLVAAAEKGKNPGVARVVAAVIGGFVGAIARVWVARTLRDGRGGSAGAWGYVASIARLQERG